MSKQGYSREVNWGMYMDKAKLFLKIPLETTLHMLHPMPRVACKRHRKDHLNKQTNKNQPITPLRVMEPLLSFLRDRASTCSVVSDVRVSMYCQTPLSRGFPRQGYWNGLPFPPPGNLPDPGIEPTSLVSLTL